MVENGTITTNYTYGSYNRLTQAGSTTSTYDDNGNMITKTGGWTYIYDHDDRLTKATKDGVTKGEYFYDGDNMRVRKVTYSPSKTEVFTYLGFNILYEKNTGTGVTVKYYYANGLQIAKIDNGATSYYHHDHLGSIRVVTGALLQINYQSNYKPFGIRFGGNGSSLMMYTGKRKDEETGLYYFGARYYDESIGRFITQDPIRSINQYIYANDNPMKFVDPAGMRAVREDEARETYAKGSSTSLSNSMLEQWVGRKYTKRDYEKFVEDMRSTVNYILDIDYQGRINIKFGDVASPSTLGDTITLPESFEDTLDPDLGAIVHEMAHVWLGEYFGWQHDENNRWIDEGVAEYVRTKAGFPQSAKEQPAHYRHAESFVADNVKKDPLWLGELLYWEGAHAGPSQFLLDSLADWRSGEGGGGAPRRVL